MKASDLIINPDGSIYHLKLRPEELPDLVLVVGDPGRVGMVSAHFDHIEFKKQNREFVSHTGMLKGQRLMALSTGIGPDNIDIVMNELDALANIDLERRETRPAHRTLTVVRLGTTGTLHADIATGGYALASHGLGLDGSLNYYSELDQVKDHELSREFIRQTGWPSFLGAPYIIPGTEDLVKKLELGAVTGITATGAGFYGPQGRELRLGLAFPDMLDRMTQFSHSGHRIVNIEMETSSLYGFGRMLGHRVASICVILANRATGEYSGKVKKQTEGLITYVLEKLFA
ncbi:MAG: nucleoside phosphorylase [Bacteroidales bacterium]|nr:nucleoside phosphorylase [Bacteroidales bacterium]